VVDVVDLSPAWLAGLRSQAWIIKVDGKPFSEFERAGAPVGATVNVEAFHYLRGRLNAPLTLIEEPKRKRAPRVASRARVPGAECGRRDHSGGSTEVAHQDIHCQVSDGRRAGARDVPLQSGDR
jgi:hypothetical protein